jgi:hypothetical protein
MIFAGFLGKIKSIYINWLPDIGQFFCGSCGSHLPDPNPDKSTFWVPTGLLEQRDHGTKIGAHVFVDSKASWDLLEESAVQYLEGFG